MLRSVAGLHLLCRPLYSALQWYWAAWYMAHGCLLETATRAASEHRYARNSKEEDARPNRSAIRYKCHWRRDRLPSQKKRTGGTPRSSRIIFTLSELASLLFRSQSSLVERSSSLVDLLVACHRL